MKHVLLLVFGLSHLGLLAQANWVPLNEDHVIAINAPQYPGGLFDEGPRLFHNETKERSQPKRAFQALPQSLYLPQKYIVKLPGFFQLDSLAFFDGAGKDSFRIAIRNYEKWDTVFEGLSNQYQTWRSLKLDHKTHFLLLEFHSAQAQLGEILVYGQEIVGRPLPPLNYPPKKKPLTLGAFMGINAFVDDPIDKVQEVSSRIREYHNWNWHYREGLSLDNALKLGPSFAPSGNGHWNFDAYYKEVKGSGLDIFPCIQGSPDWLSPQFDDKPLRLPSNPEDPHAYRIHSKFLFQYGARYGRKSHPAESLHVAPGQQKRSGLNLIQGIENWNEPDKWWRGKTGYFSAWEFAALLSADYDGHAGSLGAGYGVKNADPSLEFIMGGICSLNTDYIEAIRLWSLLNRPKKDFPADAINFHHYSNDAGGQGDRIKHGVSPEEDDLYNDLKAVIQYRAQFLPDKKVYLTEFGYDSNRKSVQAAPAADSLQSLDRQANLIVRSFLLAHAAGLDGAFLYMYRDVNTANPTKFQSSGLSREKWNRAKLKPSFYKLRSLKRLLGDYAFVEEVRAKFVPGIHVFRYRNAKGKERYALWNENLGSTYFPRSLSFAPAKEGKVYRLHAKEGPIRQESWKQGEELAIDASPLIIEFD